MLPVSVVSLRLNADEMVKKVPGAGERAILRVSTRSSHACAPSGDPDLGARRVISWAKDNFSSPTAMTKGRSGGSAMATGLQKERLKTVCMLTEKHPGCRLLTAHSRRGFAAARCIVDLEAYKERRQKHIGVYELFAAN
jgi:hypothetical protein